MSTLTERIKQKTTQIYDSFQVWQNKNRSKNFVVPITDQSFFSVYNVINEGPYKGKRSYYLVALLNALIRLKPRVCLEIGTHKGGSAEVFEYYFKNYRPDGRLITADIKKYVSIEAPSVTQVLVYPHVLNTRDFHIVATEDMLPNAEQLIHESLERNTDILKSELAKIGEEAFDFCYVDGDHQTVSFMRDFEVAKRLSKYPHFMLIDDTADEVHECAAAYREQVAPQFSHYDFDNWPFLVGAGLIWDKSFDLEKHKV